MSHPPAENYPSTPVRSRLPWILAGAVVTALAVLAAAIVYSLNRGEDVTARWETPSTMTSNPWTPSIVKPGAPVTVPGNFVGAASVTSVVAGDDCDKAALKRHLASDPKLARNWAEILEIAVADIDSYIDGLQSRRLAVPVQVTNHDYEGDRPRELQSVLDVGTAVLTDADGTPRVRCACGNPLKPAAGKATKFDNLPPGADAGAVVTDTAANHNKGTAIRIIKRPITKTSSGTQPTQGYTISRNSVPRVFCRRGSTTPYGTSASRCSSTGDGYSTCWPTDAYVSCLWDITQTELSEYPVDDWSDTDDAYHPTIELANGFLCTRQPFQGNPRDGLQGKFACQSGDVHSSSSKHGHGWGEIDHRQSMWTILFSTDNQDPLTAVDIRVAYYAIDET